MNFYAGLGCSCLLLALSACDKKGDTTVPPPVSSGSTAATPGSATPGSATPGSATPGSAMAGKMAGMMPTADGPKAPSPFAAWDLPAIAKRWQGAWVVGGSSLGTKEAWEVVGDKVTVFDGKTEKSLTFAVTSPCTLKTIDKTAGGSSSTTSKFTFNGEKLHAGLGDSGVKKGKEAVACISDAVVAMDATGKCTEWKEGMFGDGKWDSKDAKCAWGKDGGKDAFIATVRDYEYKVPVVGDVLASDQIARNVAEKHADFASAKAALAKKK